MRSDENDQKTIKKLDDAVKTIETLLDDPQWHKTAESEIEVMANYAAYFSPAKAPSDGIIDWARKTTEHENANADAKKAFSNPAVHTVLEKCARAAVDAGKAVPPFAGNKGTVKPVEGVKADARYVASEMVRKHFPQDMFANIMSDASRAYDAHYLQQALSQIVGDMTEQIIDAQVEKEQA